MGAVTKDETKPIQPPTESLTRKRVPILGAPTAAGKTAAALHLAADLPLEVISADAMMVYHGLDIGTAKPTPAEQARLPHHLIDVVEPEESFSVADFVRLAEVAIADVWRRGNVPLVVGGTGFYIRALSTGLPTVPAADEQAQAEVWARLEREGLDVLVDELAAASPADATRAERNPRRVVRALEILKRTGRAPASFPSTQPAFLYDKVVLLPSLEVLRPRIALRTEIMFNRGLVEEVAALQRQHPAQTTARQAIGYKEVGAFLRGDLTLAEANAAVTLATVQYAKRQRTWFRKERGANVYEAVATDVLGELRVWLEGWVGSGGERG
ncbi:tRNA (adenosine(37)-N6)-dimethylallyltransferase MiaA [soil metagenome]